MSFVQKQLIRRLKNRCESESTFNDLIEVRDDTVSILNSRYEDLVGIKFQPDNESYLISQYLLGFELSYSTIVEGFYAQAANLQRQQVETVAALKEFGIGKRKNKKAPNIRNNYRAFYEMYRDLSDAAHPTNFEVVFGTSYYQDGEKVGPSVYPQFKAGLCEALLWRHCLVAIAMWNGVNSHYHRLLGIQAHDSEVEMAKRALHSLEGIKLDI